jgi:hypothetical protein
LNLRPPGPQRVGSEAAQLLEPALRGLDLAELGSVSLSLFPRLFRERVFGRVISGVAPAFARESSSGIPRMRVPRGLVGSD